MVFEDSFVAPDGGDPSNRFFDADQTAQCASLCPEGSFGNCSLLGASCLVRDWPMHLLPPGRTGISQVTGSTSMEEGCRICPEGYAAAAAGTVESCFKCSKRDLRGRFIWGLDEIKRCAMYLTEFCYYFFNIFSHSLSDLLFGLFVAETNRQNV